MYVFKTRSSVGICAPCLNEIVLDISHKTILLRLHRKLIELGDAFLKIYATGYFLNILEYLQHFIIAFCQKLYIWPKNKQQSYSDF